MAANIISMHDLSIDAERNQPSKSKLVLYKPLIYFNSQLYINTKTGNFSYKGGCGVHGFTHIQVFKIRVDLGYK